MSKLTLALSPSTATTGEHTVDGVGNMDFLAEGTHVLFGSIGNSTSGLLAGEKAGVLGKGGVCETGLILNFWLSLSSWTISVENKNNSQCLLMPL